PRPGRFSGGAHVWVLTSTPPRPAERREVRRMLVIIKAKTFHQDQANGGAFDRRVFVRLDTVRSDAGARGGRRRFAGRRQRQHWGDECRPRGGKVLGGGRVVARCP